MAEWRAELLEPSVDASSIFRVLTVDKTRPRFDQFPSNASEDDSQFETLSHAYTTVNSRMDGHGSVYSYNSTRDVSQFVQEHFGRTFNSLNEMYILPTDEEEWKRLDKQHAAFLLSMGGVAPCPEIVDRLLAPDGGQPKCVLDVGCGTGSWAIEIAHQYPQARVKAVDLAPTPFDSTTLPPNLQFEIDDINGGLEHFHGQYDLVHFRLVRSGISDFDETLQQLQLCLRPGGMLLIIEADIEFQDEDHVKVKLGKIEGDEDVSGVGEDGSLIARMHWEQIEAVKLSGSDWDHSSEVIDLGLWNQPLLDPETARTGSLFLPIGPWAHSSDPTIDQSLKNVGVIMRQVCANLHRAFHASLKRFGMSAELLEALSKIQDEELSSMRHHISVRMPFCFARRRAVDGESAPPLPPIAASNVDGVAPSSTRGQPLPTRFPAPFFEIFNTAQEAKDARIKRRSTLREMPTSAVVRAFRAS